MNVEQIAMIEKELTDEPHMRLKLPILQTWVDKLNQCGTEITTTQLRTWIYNRRGKLAQNSKQSTPTNSNKKSMQENNVTDPKRRCLRRKTTNNRGNNQGKSNELVTCTYCEALVWKSESLKQSGKEMKFSICCLQGRTPAFLDELLSRSASFQSNIRAYNSMLAFTSMGGKIDYNINSGNGPFTFRMHGQNYHQIGSLLPIEGDIPRFAQLYIYDTAHEVQNRLNALAKGKNNELDEDILRGLIQMLDEYNKLVRVFRMARDRYESGASEEYSIRLIKNKERGRQFDLPQGDEIAGLIVGDMSNP